MRFLTALCAVALLACVGRADDAPPKKYYLIDGRVESAEKRIADLERRVAELEKLAGAKSAGVNPVAGAPACACGDACPCAAPARLARPLHVSPDGTVNELHPDGVYRPLPGAPKRPPVYAAPVPGGSVVPTVAPYQLDCPSGVCPLPGARRGPFRP